MTDFTNRPWPTLWPVGARLRFTRSAKMRRRYLYLRYTPILVLNDTRDRRDEDHGVQQLVYAFGAASPHRHVGWADPEQLEPIPDQADDEYESTQASDGAMDGPTVTYPVGECRIGMPEQVEKCP